MVFKIPDIDETQAPLLDHLIELRARLLRAFAALMVAFFVCFYFAQDILAFLVARHFRTGIYSSVLGLLTGVCSIAAASGAMFLSWSIARTGSFDQFLVLTGSAVILGALLLLLLRHANESESESESVGKSEEEDTGNREPRPATA